VGGLGSFSNDHFTPLFPNAVLHLSRKHFEYAKNPTVRDSGSFEHQYFIPMLDWYEEKNQIHWLDTSEGEILNDRGEWLRFISSHGHTPHQIHPYTEEYMYMADILPTSHHLKIPWVMGYDIAPGISTQDKQTIYEFILSNNLKCVFEHDPEYWGGKIKLDQKNQFVWEEIYRVQNLQGVDII
jgi:glyoxylase-like metal-dependent hydrolase (beta-lactamase superfamily II)